MDNRITDKKIRILVADDEDLIRLSLEKFLESAGYSVDVVNNGIEAIQKLDNDQYDVVVADLNMPDSGGMEMLMKLSEQTSPPSLIFFTSKFANQFFNEFHCENTYRIDKPFKMEEVISTIKQAVAPY